MCGYVASKLVYPIIRWKINFSLVVFGQKRILTLGKGKGQRVDEGMEEGNVINVDLP